MWPVLTWNVPAAGCRTQSPSQTFCRPKTGAKTAKACEPKLLITIHLKQQVRPSSFQNIPASFARRATGLFGELPTNPGGFGFWITVFFSISGRFHGPQSRRLLTVRRFFGLHSLVQFFPVVLHRFTLLSFDSWKMDWQRAYRSASTSGGSIDLHIGGVDEGAPYAFFFDSQCQLVRSFSMMAPGKSAVNFGSPP